VSTSGIVDENRDLRGLRFRPLSKFVDGSCAADIEVMGLHQAGSGCPGLRGGIRERIDTAGTQQEIATGLRKREGRGRSETAGGAGNENPLVFEIESHGASIPHPESNYHMTFDRRASIMAAEKPPDTSANENQTLLTTEE
jgi:hypothetical protein